MVSSVHRSCLPDDKKSARLLDYVDKLAATIKLSPVRENHTHNRLVGLEPNCSHEAIRHDALQQGEAISPHQGQESAPPTQPVDEFGRG
jgi:hypothetical protein